MTARPSPLRTNLGVVAGTAASRASGYGRILALAYLMQTTTARGDPGAQLSAAYVLANTAPNIVYDLVLGGVLSATLVPLFTASFKRKDDRAISAIVTTAVAGLAAVTVLATLAAPLIIRFYTTLRLDPDLDPAQYQRVSTTLAYFFLPQIFFYGVAAIATALLNARGRFFAAAWAPAVNNVVAIVLLLLTRRIIDGAPGLSTVQDNATFRVLLGLGATAGVAASALVLLPSVIGAGIRIVPKFAPRHPEVRRLIKLSGWTAGYVIANQLALLIVTQLAQRSSGGYVAYSTMYVFFQLPYGLLAVTIMTTVSPELARDAVNRDFASFRERIQSGLWLITLCMVPATVVFVAFARPITRLAGNFGNLADSPDVLAAFAAGLVAFSAYLFIMRGFYALHNTKSPFVINLVENALNVILALVLVGRWGVVGLAWAFSIAYAISAVFAYWVLSNWARGLGGRVLVARLARLATVTVATSIAGYAARDNVRGRGVSLFVRLGIATAIVVGVYLALLGALQLLDMRRVSSLAASRGRRNE